MKVGAEDKKKVATAIGLSLIAAGTVYVQFFSGGSAGGGPAGRTQPVGGALPAQIRPARTVSRPAAQSTTTRRSTAVRGQNFEPVWRRSHEDETFDPLEADPTLRIELLAAVRQVGAAKVERNIFEFTARRQVVKGPSPSEVEAAKRLQQAAERPKSPAAAPRPSAPTKPQAPKINWKYYGFAADSGEKQRRAFLLDGEHVLIGGVGDIFRDRYEIVRVSLTSIVIKDRQYDAEHTLALEVPRG